ncbi:glutamate receptor ionotropic, kainate 1-like [Palaemon carinicauda]|uniref:glutamate receptor ionotropic, kainate 1-like n=1 Tax=Palaemon carinicauda TaxID=392227 RepID=UPI0035B65342
MKFKTSMDDRSTTKLKNYDNNAKKPATTEGLKKVIGQKGDSRMLTVNEYRTMQPTNMEEECLRKPTDEDENAKNFTHDKDATWMNLKSNGQDKFPEVAMSERENISFRFSNITKELLIPSLGSGIGMMVWQTLEDGVTGCQFVLLTTDIRQPVVSYVIGYSFTTFEPVLVVDISKIDYPSSSNLKQEMWGGPNTVCRVAIIDLIQDDDNTVLRYLESSKFYLWPDSRVVIIGKNSEAQLILSHRLFRNVRHPIYLGLQESTMEGLLNHASGREVLKGNVVVYSRCMYCDAGTSQKTFLFLWPIGSKMPHPINSIPDRLLDLKGHMFKVLSMPTFPYSAYRRDSDEAGSTLTLLDSVDKRALEVVSSHLNFTYDIRIPMDGQWGVSAPSGNWTGMVGALQFETADFTTTIAPTLGRLDVIDTTKTCTADVLAVVCLKPQLIPQYLVIIKPFAVDVWLCILASIMVWGFSFWAVQKVWSWNDGEQCMSLDTAIFCSWAIILDDPQNNPPSNIPSRVMLLFWLVACLVIATGYRSSLVAFLGVQSKERPIDSFQDLAAQKGFGWGIEYHYLTGIALIFFQSSPDPNVQKIYRKMDYIDDIDDAFDKISRGKYAMITYAKQGRTLIDSYYTDKFGNTPFYVGKEGSSLVPYFGWGYRKGAPFRDRFNNVLNRLNEAGIMDFWTGEVMAGKVRENRKVVKEKEDNKDAMLQTVTEDVATMQIEVIHTVGIFLVLLLGYFISFITFLCEKIMPK